MRDLRIGVGGVLGVERGEPSSLWERKRGTQGMEPIWGWTWAQPRDRMCKVPKSQWPLPLPVPGLERRSQSLMTPMRSGGG